MKVLQMPPAYMEHMDHDEQPPIRPPDKHDTPRWMAHYRRVQRILVQQNETDLNLAMQQAATACGIHGGHRCAQDDATPHQDLPSMVTAIWRDKRALHTLVHPPDAQAQHEALDIAAQLDTTRRQLRKWHVHRAKELAPEQQCYFQNPEAYKSLKHVDKVLGDTGHQGIKAIRLQTGTVINDPKWSFKKSSTASKDNTTPRTRSYPRTQRN